MKSFARQLREMKSLGTHTPPTMALRDSNPAVINENGSGGSTSKAERRDENVGALDKTLTNIRVICV